MTSPTTLVPHRFLIAANPRRIRKFPAKGARDFATLNHYALRSLDSYLVKNDRGDVNRENRAFDDTYWRERNDSSVPETSILRMIPALKAELAQLMDDPAIAALHQDCVRLHREKRDALLDQPAYRDMQAQLRSVPSLPQAELELLAKLGVAP